MFSRLLLPALLLSQTVSAAPWEQISISIHADEHGCNARNTSVNEPLDPPIVPLHPRARTGVFDPIFEEGLIRSLGNRFANPFYEHSDAYGDSPEGLGPCVLEIAKFLPCLFAAIAKGSVSDALKCADKGLLCGCANFLPQAAETWVNSHICHSSLVASEDLAAGDDAPMSMIEFADTADDSAAIQAFRGDMKQSLANKIKDSCILAVKCGKCCCTGACLDGQCIGLSGGGPGC